MIADFAPDTLLAINPICSLSQYHRHAYLGKFSKTIGGIMHYALRF